MADPLDPNALHQLRDLMGEDFRALIGAFLSDSSSRMADIETALSLSDQERLRRSTHSLKGMCLNLGALPLAEALADLETAIRTGPEQSLPPLIETVRNEYTRARDAAAGLALS